MLSLFLVACAKWMCRSRLGYHERDANPTLAHLLADALDDAGAPDELAEHFRSSAHPSHPRGCWALDAILDPSRIFA